MKTQDILILLLILILLFPSGPIAPQRDMFALYAAEGMVATQVFSNNGTDLKPQPDVTPTPNPQYKCEKCKDLGYITTGDGINKFPCPDCKVPKVTGCQCGGANCKKENCTCGKGVGECAPKTAQDPPKVFTEVKESGITALLFTQPPTCPPCRQYETQVKPELLKLGIKISKDKDSIIREIDPTRGTKEEAALWAQYGGLGVGIPLFVFIKDGKVVETKNHFIDLKTTLKLLGR